MTQERFIINSKAVGGGYSAHVLAAPASYQMPEFAIPVMIMSAPFDESTPHGEVTANFAGYEITHDMGVAFKTYVYWWPMGDDEEAELALVEAELEKIPVFGQGIPAYEKDVVSITKVETEAPHDLDANQSLTLTNISPGPDPALDSNWSWVRSSEPPFDGAWVWNGDPPAPEEPEFSGDVRPLIYVGVITNSLGLSRFFQGLASLPWGNGTTTASNVWGVPTE
jgi:hypothetical protein